MENLIYQSLNLITVKCCICETNNANLAGNGKDYEYNPGSEIFSAMQCNTCGLVYLNPRPGVEEFEKIYPANYHAFDFSEKEFGIVHKIRSWLEGKRLLVFCENVPDNGKVLDVGCGDGFHLNLLRKYGNKTWTLEGIDMDERAIKMAVKSGLNVYKGTLETINLNENTYDLAFTIQTIEHVEKPDEFLKSIFKLLKPGGRLVIVTDNTDCLDFKIFKKHFWGGYHFPRHWNLFNKNSLSKLAQKTGFEVDLITTQVSPVNWVYSIHNWLIYKNAPSWLIKRFTLKSTVSLAAFTLLDMALQKFRKGALIRAFLKKTI
jgi:2-polyprenyl-3-methyl-5-hydroxy-6-metoxy-1,4-benzoquinol methylase